jgi:hypothetical protein
MMIEILNRICTRQSALGLRVLVFMTASLVLLACSSEKGPEQKDKEALPEKAAQEEKAASTTPPPSKAPKSYSLEIYPGDPVITSAVKIRPSGFGPSDVKITWLLNGSPISTISPEQFDIAVLRSVKGDIIQAKAVVDNTEVFSNTVIVRNSLPELTKVKLMPETFKPGDTLRIDAEAKDADGDPVAIEYEWKVNDKPAGTGKNIGKVLKRGDKFSVKVMPFDGEEYGHHAYLERELKNVPPMFVEDNRFIFEGGIFSFRPQATDPDGDPVQYSLKSGPDGMTIEAETGVVMWTVPPELNKAITFIVAAEDGQGGRSEMAYTFTPTQEQPGSKEQ